MELLNGLSTQEARSLKKQGKANVVPNKTSKSAASITIIRMVFIFRFPFSILHFTFYILQSRTNAFHPP